MISPLGSLIVVRHARPEVDPDVPARSCPLTPQGVRAAEQLAHHLDLDGGRVVSSPETRATQTARPLAARFGVNVDTDERLRETARPWVVGEYEQLAARWLSGEAVQGWEHHGDVVARMEAALGEVLSTADTPIVVGHGLALTAWIYHRLGDLDPVAFWQELAMPDALRIDLETRSVVRPLS